MQANVLSYGDLTEQWKVDLIIERAKSFGIPEHDWPDVQQTVILDILNFKYDINDPRKAKERTVLTTLIDNKITDILRKQSVYDKHEEEVVNEILREFGVDFNGERSISYNEDHTLEFDIQEAMAHMSGEEKAVCIGLMAGCSIREIAQKLYCRRQSVRHMIENIRRIFKELELDQWLQ